MINWWKANECKLIFGLAIGLLTFPFWFIWRLIMDDNEEKLEVIAGRCESLLETLESRGITDEEVFEILLHIAEDVEKALKTKLSEVMDADNS